MAHDAFLVLILIKFPNFKVFFSYSERVAVKYSYVLTRKTNGQGRVGKKHVIEKKLKWTLSCAIWKRLRFHQFDRMSLNGAILVLPETEMWSRMVNDCYLTRGTLFYELILNLKCLSQLSNKFDFDPAQFIAFLLQSPCPRYIRVNPSFRGLFWFIYSFCEKKKGFSSWIYCYVTSIVSKKKKIFFKEREEMNILDNGCY